MASRSLIELRSCLFKNSLLAYVRNHSSSSLKDASIASQVLHNSTHGHCLTSTISDNRISTIALSIPIGSRYELYNEKGLSHLLKCMAFKSNTKGPSQLAIARTSELLGISLKSILTRESLTIYADALPDDIDFVFQVFSSFLTNSEHPKQHELSETLRAVRFDTLQSNSDPHYSVHEALLQTAFKSGLGNPMLATEWRVSALSLEKLSEFKRRILGQKDSKYSLIGINIPLETLKQYEKEYLYPIFSSFKHDNCLLTSSKYIGGENIIETGHGSLNLGLAFPIKHNSRHGLSVVRSILIGDTFVPYSNPVGMIYKASIGSSKLVPFMSLFSDAGIFGCIISSQDHRSLFEGGKSITKLLRRGMEKQITKEMVEKAKNIAKVNYASKLETRQGFIQDALDQISTSGKYSSISSVFQSIDSISLEDIQKILKDLANSKPTFVMLGSDLDGKSFIEHLSTNATTLSI